MPMQSKSCLLIAILPALLFSALPAGAQAYPTKPIRFIVPFTPGGVTDLLGRQIGVKLSEAWGQQIIIDNRPGAGGTLGVELAARAPADGYTIAVGTFGSVLVANSLYPKLAYEPLRDLAPVVLLSKPPGVLVANMNLPVKSVKEFVAYGKANAGKLNYASSGSGTWNHLFGELFKRTAGFDMTHVPYKGAAPAVTDVIAGHVQVMFSPFPPALPQIKAARLRGLAVSSDTRSGLVPDLPTVAESGLPGYAAVGWFAVVAPAKTPDAVLQKLNREINRILQTPEVKTNLAADGAEPAGGTPAELTASIREGIEKWGRIVKELGLKAN
jgi:tripartite-type tricarboxylate transporter receptor subunit TctC